MLDKKTFAIGILSLSAVILLAANLLIPRTATATYETTQDNDYSIVTATAIGGGDALYITEKRSGMMAVFVYNPNKKTMEAMAVKAVQSAFEKGLKR